LKPASGVSTRWVRQRADRAAPILGGRQSGMPMARRANAGGRLALGFENLNFEGETLGSCSAWVSLTLCV
jgi:hypothetical protein